MNFFREINFKKFVNFYLTFTTRLAVDRQQPNLSCFASYVYVHRGRNAIGCTNFSIYSSHYHSSLLRIQGTTCTAKSVANSSCGCSSEVWEALPSSPARFSLISEGEIRRRGITRAKERREDFLPSPVFRLPSSSSPVVVVETPLLSGSVRATGVNFAVGDYANGSGFWVREER